MMKAKIIDKEGKHGKEIELPEIFSGKIREDIAQKLFEIEKKIQPYGPNIMAGKLHSASGKIRRRRHAWKSSYGRGISRVPRKIFWRRGTQFYWQGSTVVSTVGGRAGHPPKIEKFLKKKKINKKEKLLGIQSAISSTANINYLEKRYSSLDKVDINLPLIIEGNVLKLKTKEFLELIKKVLKTEDIQNVGIKKKQKRAGKGKLRGRKYKVSAGLLLIVGREEDKKINGIDVIKADKLEMSDLYPLGRLTIYTENSIKDLEKLWNKEKK